MIVDKKNELQPHTHPQWQVVNCEYHRLTRIKSSK
jgi:hypothetical protein